MDQDREDMVHRGVVVMMKTEVKQEEEYNSW